METIQLRNTKVSDVAEATLLFQGKPYALKDYPMFPAIFNSGADRRLLKAGRQVSKTMTFAADIISRALLTPYYPMIYANTSAAQTTSFSTSKLDPFLVHSPIINRSLMLNKNVIDNVFNKRFANFAEVRLTYFSETADRVRGNTGFAFYVDEVQDMLYDALIDAEECLSAAPHPKFMYAGTSKSMITPLEYFWGMSTQKEWLIQCEGCNKYNVPSVENIGAKGLICKSCGKALNTYLGFWHAFGKEGAEYDGFRIPQIILPLHCCSPEKWVNLLQKLDKYPDYKIKNEIMGDPLGEGESLITEELLRSITRPGMHPPVQKDGPTCGGASYMAAGIDWGGGGGSGTSRTVISIYAANQAKPEYRMVAGKIFTSGEPTKHLQEIARMLNAFQVTHVYADHGGGNFAISQLAELMPQVSIVPIMYTDQAAPLRWDEKARRFTTNRTNMIDNFIGDIKKMHIRTFDWEEFEPYAMDFLNVREDTIGEDRGISKRVWRRIPSAPDDSLHSMLYGWLACRILCGYTEFTAA